MEVTWSILLALAPQEHHFQKYVDGRQDHVGRYVATGVDLATDFRSFLLLLFTFFTFSRE